MIGCYIDSGDINLSLNYKLKGHVGDSTEDLNLTLFSDADFAGRLDTPSPPTESFDFRGFDSSKLLILKGANSHVRRNL